MVGYIYCIQMGEGGPVKIGFTTKDPEQRLKQLQTGNPIKLYLRLSFPSPLAGEQRFHEAFADDRLEGEWFAPSSALFTALEAVKEHGGGLETIPPLTEAGLRLLRLEPARKVYPGGIKHNETDWDALAAICLADDSAFAEWEASQ